MSGEVDECKPLPGARGRGGRLDVGGKLGDGRGVDGGGGPVPAVGPLLKKLATFVWKSANEY